MSQPAPPAAVSSSSSSSTLWATPSKEWVIPAKPKPGRKPKKDPAPTTPVEQDQEVDSKGRRVQNRAAQRAFRERKQSQLADLQARVQQYEQGQIERNVALQNIAKRLKEENEKLQKENALLRERLAKTEGERDTLKELTKKRWREESRPPSPLGTSEYHAKKKFKVTPDQEPAMSVSHMSSPSSVSSPESLGHSSFSPAPALPPIRDTALIAQGKNGNNSLGNIFDLISTGKTNAFETGGSMDTFDCGFCNENTPCVCRELAIHQVADRMAAPVPKVESSDHPISLLNLDPDPVLPISSPVPQPPITPASILDNLPSYQPPVPLRRRAGNPGTEAIFPVTTPLSVQHASTISRAASCSGDPSNCMACADDAFGKAFCAAINKSAVAAPPCEKCPTRSVASGSNSSSSGEARVGGCCGNPALCGNHKDGLKTTPVAPVPVPCSSASSGAGISPTSTISSGSDTIPCNDAWQQIKSHPNVAFADLSLLAEVVARRSKCTGPRVEISPAPGTITPERGISPSLLSSNLPPSRITAANTFNPVHLPEPAPVHRETRVAQVRAEEQQRQGSPTVSCGRARIREVQADGVRDALRLLDLKYSTAQRPE